MRQTKKRVYTYGVFDLLHTGHIKLLEQAKALGDELIVGVFTDEVAEGFKRKPIIPLEERYKMLQSLRVVDRVYIQDQFSPQERIDFLKPDIVAKARGAGWEDTAPEYENCESILLKYTDGVSTSDIIRRIRRG